MAVPKSKTFSVSEDEDAEDINFLVDNMEENKIEVESSNGDDSVWKSFWGRLRKGRYSIGKSEDDSTENSDSDDESSDSSISSESGEEVEAAEENGGVETREEAMGKRNECEWKKGGQNARGFARVAKLTGAVLCFLVVALFLVAIAMASFAAQSR